MIQTESKVGIVVPTLGTRPEYLKLCLQSIRDAGQAHICLVAPKDFDANALQSIGLVDQLVQESGDGLAEAINLGISSLPKSIQYVNWLGDDDFLMANTLEIASGFLDRENGTVAVFGPCDYIDDSGARIWTNRSGSWAKAILRFGPDLIPQPGALLRRTAFEEIGGLSRAYGWAFDFDMFIKMSKVGKLSYIPHTLAAFRWHPDSLSVGQRELSINEASQVRKSHLPSPLRVISELWELPTRRLTAWAGKRVSKLASNRGSA